MHGALDYQKWGTYSVETSQQIERGFTAGRNCVIDLGGDTLRYTVETFRLLHVYMVGGDFCCGVYRYLVVTRYTQKQ